MEKIFLEFYGEKTIIPKPKDFHSLYEEITKIIQLNLPNVFGLDISYIKNKIKQSIKSEDDYNKFISSKIPIINLEIVELNELIKNKSKEDKFQLEALRKKRSEIKLKIEEKQNEEKILIKEYKQKLELLNKQKTQYIHELKRNMKGKDKIEKELVSKIIQLSKELNVPLIFKIPTNGVLPLKGNTQKEKDYLDLIRQYNNCLKIGDDSYLIPSQKIDDIDRQIKLMCKQFWEKNKSSQEEIFKLENEEKLNSKEIENLEVKLNLIKKESKNKEINDLVNNLRKKMKDITKRNDNIKSEIKEKIKKNRYEQREDEKELLKKIEKENKQTNKEIEKWIEFISYHCDELIDSLERKNSINLKQLEDLEKGVELKKSSKELLNIQPTGRIGAIMPYTRYDSDEAFLGGGASLVFSPNHDEWNIASQGSKQNYITLPSSGAYAEWTIKTEGRGITMRFTLPDSKDGKGQEGSLDVYVNKEKIKTVKLDSYNMWQYFPKGEQSDKPEGPPGFSFDETHFLLKSNLKVGDKIRIQSSGANGLEYGIDFLEIEEVGEPLGPPENSLSVIDSGANPDDEKDDLPAINDCIAKADKEGKNVYFPPGTYHLNGKWFFNARNIKVSGAGIWYTNILFTNPDIGQGGISGGWFKSDDADGYCDNIEFCHMYFNSKLSSRHFERGGGNYYLFGYLWANGYIHDIWEDHFECGFWVGVADGKIIDYSDGLKIINCRIRNNLADGLNFTQGTSNATVYNCSLRNNGDDSLAMWNRLYEQTQPKDTKNNVFCYNTIEFNWRASAIGIYGGNGHRIYNNYIRDTHASSGIRLVTDFQGYFFNNTKEINFINNVIIKSGSVKGGFGEECGAIEIHGKVKNITFTNTYIYDAQHDALHLGNTIKNIEFDNLFIFGTGTDGQFGEQSSLPHLGAAIMVYSPIQSCKINNITLANIACKGTQYDSEILGNYININNVTITNENDLDKTPYKIPDYPPVGHIIVDRNNIPEPDQIPQNIIKTILPNAVCYNCGNPIIGVRYKCTICKDFDFCENCEDKDKGKHGHPLLKINRPELCPISISYKFNN